MIKIKQSKNTKGKINRRQIYKIHPSLSPNFTLSLLISFHHHATFLFLGWIPLKTISPDPHYKIQFLNTIWLLHILHLLLIFHWPVNTKSTLFNFYQKFLSSLMLVNMVSYFQCKPDDFNIVKHHHFYYFIIYLMKFYIFLNLESTDQHRCVADAPFVSQYFSM